MLLIEDTCSGTQPEGKVYKGVMNRQPTHPLPRPGHLTMLIMCLFPL